MMLEEFFKDYNKVAIAFSGGVDSSYLLYVVKKLGIECTAYYVKSEFQPRFELKDSINFAKEIGAELKIIDCCVLNDEDVIKNDNKRCYYCKKNIFSMIMKNAKEDGYDTVIDGTNASDDENERPGMDVLREMKVLSPLKICSLTKSDIRKLSKEAGLSTWDKPSYSCLATRIMTNQRIDLKTLSKVEKSEAYLFELGFKDFRVRVMGNNALIQIREEDFERVLEKKDKIFKTFYHMFDIVSLDLKPRR